MSLNRSLLTQLTKDLNKKPSKPKVPKNQWQHPGEITTVNSPNITMDAVDYPVLGVPNVGAPQMMYPDQQYSFPGASNVTEFPEMQFGGLWDSNRTAWVDSVNNANMDKNFVQRMYNANAPQMYLPGAKKPSTHFMESGDGRAYPTVVQRPGNKYLEWMNQNNPDGAMNYALDTGQYIQFPNDEQATWYGQNGYKQGTNVVTGKKKKQFGGALNKYQTAGQVIKPVNGFIDLKQQGIDVFTPEGMAKAEELNKQYPGAKFVCTANGCADIASKAAQAYGHNFGRFNAWDAGNQNPVQYLNPSYTEGMMQSAEPLPNPKSYKVPSQMQGMENVLITMNRNNNLVDDKGRKLSQTPQNIALGKSKDRKSSNDSFDYKYNYPNSRGMEHVGYLKGNNTLIHGTAGHGNTPAFFVFDDMTDGIKLPGYGGYEPVEAIGEPSAMRRNWNKVSNSVQALSDITSNLFAKANAPVKGVNPASMIPNVSNIPYMVNKGVDLGSRVIDKARRAIPVGESIIDYLGQQGVNYDKATRKAIANHLGIKDYNFSADKNIELMKRIAQAPEILERFAKPKAQLGTISGVPNFRELVKNVIPVSVRSVANFAGAALGLNDSDSIVQKSDFTKDNLKAIYNAALDAQKKTGKSHNGTSYSNYGNAYGDLWGKGVPDQLRKTKLAKVPFQVANVAKDTMLDPAYQAATTLGRFTYNVNKDGSVDISDKYDFSQEAGENGMMKSIVQAIDNTLGNDPRKNIQFRISPQDIKRYGGLSRFQVAGQSNAPKVTAKVNPFMPVFDPNEANQEYQLPNDQTFFTGVQPISHEAGIAANVKRTVAQQNPELKNVPVPGSGVANATKVANSVANFGDGMLGAFNIYSQLANLNNQQAQRESNSQMLRSQNATWNQQYNPQLNRGDYSQGPSSYGLFKPNQMFAQQGIEVPLSMDEAAKYTVDSIDSLVGANTIGIGAPEIQQPQFVQQQMQEAPVQEATATPMNEPVESTESLKDSIAYKESRGNYKAFNPKGGGSGAVGKYQFRWDHNKDWIGTVTGIKNKQSFLNNPEAQEKAFDYWDQNVLTPNAQKIKSQYKPNLNINEIKMLIHFQGPTGADRYFKTGKYTTDAEGTTPMRYLGKNIDTKQGVKATNLDSNLMAFVSNMGNRFPGLTMSSGNDSQHMKGSKHYKNKAIDIGANSSNRQSYNQLANFLTKNPTIKSQYGIEDIINEGDHLHVEMMQRGGEYELTADQIMQIKAMGGDVEFI